MAKSISLAIDPAEVVNRIAMEANLELPSKIVMMHYDEEVDTLYVHFEYPAEAIDSEVIDKHGEIILGLDQNGRIVNMTIINASTYRKTP